MIRRLLLALAAACLLAAPAPASSGPAPRIAIVSIHLAEFPNLAREAAAARRDRLQIDLYGLGGGLLPSVDGVDLSAYDLVVVDGAAPRLLNFKPQFDAAVARTKVVVLDNDTWVKGNVSAEVAARAQVYWRNATAENYGGLYDYLAQALLRFGQAAADPVIYPLTAFYDPDAPTAFESRASLEAWQAARRPGVMARPTVGVVFYRSLALARNTAVIDALIREIDRQGGRPVALWRDSSADPLAANLAGVDALILCANQINYADHAAGVAEANRLGVPVLSCNIAYSQTPAEWTKSPGGFAPNQTGELSLGEVEGIVEPMTVGARSVAADGTALHAPIAAQVEWRVARALSWARLKRKANFEKRIVIPYYSEEGGRANVGSDPDTYLDAQASLVALLNRLRAEGYDLGAEPIPDAAALARRMADEGSNVGVWAPDELEARVKAGKVALIPEAQYLEWWSRAPQDGRRHVEEIWGPPPGRLMVQTTKDGKRDLVIPLLTFGKIALAPHPTWGYLQNDKALANVGAMPPHHQYIAFYAWMREVWKADAFLTVFTQLSLMPGKQEGPARNDWVGWLIGDTPHIQPMPLSANGGVGNKRRTQAVGVGFMPALKRMGLPPDLATLQGELAGAGGDAGKQEQVRALAGQLDLDRALDIDVQTASWADLSAALDEYLADISKAVSPIGGHVLGEPPAGEDRDRMVQAMLAGDMEVAPDVAAVSRALAGDTTALEAATHERAMDYAARLEGAPAEIDNLVAALSGRYVEPGPNQDAVRNPDALPSGRNPYTLDTRRLPTKAAWETGSKLADDMASAYLAKHGRYPQRTAFVLWSSESVTNQGVMESQILRLLGARPVWNPRGAVVDVALDDAATLGRPRIDVLVTTSGTYRDHFGDKIALIAKAVRLAAAAQEPGNPVRAAAQDAEQRLIAGGASPEEARVRSLRRIFSTAPGAYSPSTQFALKAGPQWDDEKIGKLYNDRMGHAYGDGEDGVADPEAFMAGLDRVDSSVFSRSSNALGLLETPMPAAYFGGLSMAVRQRTGVEVEAFVADLTSPGRASLQTIDRAFQKELASRYFNPEWIKAMQKGGYNGARYMAEFADNMLMWDVVTPELVSDADWEQAKAVFVDDRYGLDMAAYFDRANPHAKQQMLHAMLDAIARGRWNADAATKASLSDLLADEVARHGATCDRASCDPDFGGKAVAPAVFALPAAAAPGAAAQASVPSAAITPASPQVRGFQMQEMTPEATPLAPSPTGLALWLCALLCGALMAAGGLMRPRW